MRSDTYQVLLIISGFLVTAFFGVFVYREMYPEYKTYQNDYIDLEKFRSTYTHTPPTEFKVGVKQIVIEREDNGPPTIDRCTTCHVALQIPYFSPTKLAQDINGNIILDAAGKPIQFPNEEYIWDKLDQKIAELKDEKVNEQLTKEGNTNEVKRRLKEAESYEDLKVAHVGEYEYDVKKVLSMHPLIGKETRPFQFHPLDEYGCTSCHNGNGRGLVTDKAHGPVFDEHYEEEFEGPTPHFTEKDQENDPAFSRIFNHKPGEELIFQTQPIFVGPLIQAKCMQCHQTSQLQMNNATASAAALVQRSQNQYLNLQNSFLADKETVSSLLTLRKRLKESGYSKTLDYLQQQMNKIDLTSQQYSRLMGQETYLEKWAAGAVEEEKKQANLLKHLNKDLEFYIGSQQLIDALQKELDANTDNPNIVMDSFLKEHQNETQAKGELFDKAEAIDLQQDLIRHAAIAGGTYNAVGKDQNVVSALQGDIDELTKNFQNGQQLYLSQACYACHRIAGFSRGGIGPELTKEGNTYPWFIKESIVWPQADTPGSTMPNMRLDHDEVEDLTTFLLAQHGGDKAVSKIGYQTAIKAWEAGKKQEWEEPVPSAKIKDLRYAMTVFATEGCASCHRLEGFESNVGFTIEKNKHTLDELIEEKQWFKNLFPEQINVAQFDEQLPGSNIVSMIEKNAKEIDQRISPDVRTNAILEEIESSHPGSIEALYSNFKYAARAKNHYFDSLLQNEKDSEKKGLIEKEKQEWKKRVHNVLMMYIQVYGLGRLIGPRPNWSGIFRTDEWLIEHFHNPTAHVPHSIMPIMPFDDTKFLALTNMLNVLAPRNRDAVQAVWTSKGFNPEAAYITYCAQCHGEGLSGNGSIAEWIYPIPKNLRNPDFLRNLTKERAIYSIHHGVSGTPMPPWGEIASGKSEEVSKLIGNRPVLNEGEIKSLVEWLFRSLPGGEFIRSDVPKWEYGPEDVIKELKNEKGILVPKKEVREPSEKKQENHSKLNSILDLFPTGKGCYASLKPVIYDEKTTPDPNQEEGINTIFDKEMSTDGAPDPYKYYIKQKYYTDENIESGRRFFLLNCAVCHGNEGDGTGNRSSSMVEAKPRMFTNLDWSHSRDDLRLLRSIKYGVHGTSMTPWGDQTSTLQRLQLVIFIRTLTHEREKRERVLAALYRSFESPKYDVDEAWMVESQQLIELQEQQKKLVNKQAELEFQTPEGDASLEEAVKFYKENLEITKKISVLQGHIQRYQELRNEIKKEKDLFYNLGEQLLNNKNITNSILDSFIDLINLNENIYQLKEGHLTMQADSGLNDKMRQIKGRLINEVNLLIDNIKEAQKLLNAQSESEERAKELSDIKGELDSLIKVRMRLITDLDDAFASFEKQKQLLNEINKTKIQL